MVLGITFPTLFETTLEDYPFLSYRREEDTAYGVDPGVGDRITVCGCLEGGVGTSYSLLCGVPPLRFYPGPCDQGGSSATTQEFTGVPNWLRGPVVLRPNVRLL